MSLYKALWFSVPVVVSYSHHIESWGFRKAAVLFFFTFDKYDQNIILIKYNIQKNTTSYIYYVTNLTDAGK